MRNYAMYEGTTIRAFRRGLLTFNEASNRLYGYLVCMADMEIISRDRISEEYSRAIKELLNIEIKKEP